jgi:hypothetical protein
VLTECITPFYQCTRYRPMALYSTGASEEKEVKPAQHVIF